MAFRCLSPSARRPCLPRGSTGRYAAPPHGAPGPLPGAPRSTSWPCGASLALLDGVTDPPLEEEPREAHLSAEQPEAGQAPRLPPSDEHPSGSRHPEVTPGEGPASAVGLTGRIRERAVFDRFRTEGRRLRHGVVWCTWIDDASVVPARVAYAIGRPARRCRGEEPRAPAAAGPARRRGLTPAAGAGLLPGRRPAGCCRRFVRRAGRRPASALRRLRRRPRRSGTEDLGTEDLGVDDMAAAVVVVEDTTSRSAAVPVDERDALGGHAARR